MTLYLQALIDGLLVGGVYASIGVGLSLAFGVMRIVNWAHGEFLMVSMYISYYLFTSTHMSPYIIMFISGIIMFLFGYMLQKYIFASLLDRETAREPISVLLFTIGLAMLLTNLILVVIGSNPLTIITNLTGKMWELGGIMFSVTKLLSFIIAVGCTLILYNFLKYTEMGRAIRAVSQNRNVATLMGIDQKKIFKVSFGISCALTGISGAVLLPYFPVSTTIGTTFGFRSFVIVVLGGQGSVIGALLGGLIVGVTEKVGGQLLNDTYAQMLVFIIFVLILLFKPYGLLGEKEKQ